MQFYWLEQSARQVPTRSEWLAPGELLRLSSFSVPKRRSDWQLGRWTAKCAVAAHLNLPFDHRSLATIEIRPTPSGAPELYISDTAVGLAISLSHSAGTAICALSPNDVRLGCDVELIEARSKAFLEDYFTLEEQLVVGKAPISDRPRLITLLWSAKESALKAMKQGLRLDTRSVIVQLQDSTHEGRWSRFEVHSQWGDHFDGWCLSTKNIVRAVVSDCRSSEPISLQESLAEKNSVA